MRSQTRTTGLIMALSLFYAQGAAFEIATGSNGGAGELVSISAPAATGLVELPIGSPGQRSLYVETGYIRQFEIKELDQLFLAAAVQGSRFGLAVGLMQLGQTDFYAEQTAKTTLSYFYDSIAVGLSLSLLQVDAGGRFEPISASGIGLGMSLRRNRILAAFAVDDINSPRLHSNAVAFRPRYTVHAEILGLQSYSVFGRVRLQKKEKPRFALGQRFDFSSYSSAFWFVSTAALQYGAGIQVKQAKMRLAYSLSYHPTLDLSHSISFAYLFTRIDGRKK